MKILIQPTQEQAVDCVAGLIAAQVRQRPETVFGLATGGTMEAVYARLIGMHHETGLSFARAQSFNLDEYVGLSPDHPASYWHYMRQHLFDHVDFHSDATHLPRGDAPDPAEEAARYEARIKAAGDIGFQLLGLGANGHIGFNEPTSSLASLTRIKTLAKSTRDSNARFFERAEDVPRLAITMGIGTIMRAQDVVLLAYGAGKASAVARMVEGPVTATCPASILQMHPKATVVIDEAAAADLTLRDYLDYVHPEGRDPAI